MSVRSSFHESGARTADSLDVEGQLEATPHGVPGGRDAMKRILHGISRRLQVSSAWALSLMTGGEWGGAGHGYFSQK